MRWTAFASWGLGILLSLACGPQKPVENDQRLLPPAAKYCAGPDCKKKSSDIAKLDLTTDKNPTNQREVLLRWTAAAEQAYVLQASRDPDCSQVFEARTTQKGETSFSQLDDGVWYFCLREANTKRVLSSDETLGVLQITVDRAAPTFQLPADLSLEGGTILDLKVRDLLDYSCEWASTATNLALEPQGPGQVKLLNIFSGSFPLSIQCRDVAGN
jgi:hypothetical protein